VAAQVRPSAVVDRLLAGLGRAGRRMLEADLLLVAAEGAAGMTVRAVAGPDDAPVPGTRVVQEGRLPDGVPVPVRISPRGDSELVVAAAPEGGSCGLACLADDGRRVLVVAGGVASVEAVVDGEVIGELAELACHMVTAERSAVLGTLRESLQEREDERRRWARELHDDTLQQLGALQVLLTSALRGPRDADGGRRLVDAVRRATELLAGQIAGLRQLIAELRPATLDELGLDPPLRTLARRTEELSGIPVSLHVSLRYSDGIIATRLLPDIELAVYRVVQEALTNVQRHSAATRAAVTVVEDDETVVAEVSDNGRGFDPDKAVGFGLDGMHERAELAGGIIEFRPAARTGGTTVRLTVPATHRRS
jgi:two-component system, NarL family, sensor histidine kinase DevS